MMQCCGLQTPPRKPGAPPGLTPMRRGQGAYCICGGEPWSPSRTPTCRRHMQGRGCREPKHKKRQLHKDRLLGVCAEAAQNSNGQLLASKIAVQRATVPEKDKGSGRTATCGLIDDDGGDQALHSKSNFTELRELE